MPDDQKPKAAAAASTAAEDARWAKLDEFIVEPEDGSRNASMSTATAELAGIAEPDKFTAAWRLGRKTWARSLGRPQRQAEAASCAGSATAGRVQDQGARRRLEGSSLRVCTASWSGPTCC